MVNGTEIICMELEALSLRMEIVIREIGDFQSFMDKVCALACWLFVGVFFCACVWLCVPFFLRKRLHCHGYQLTLNLEFNNKNNKIF